MISSDFRLSARRALSGKWGKAVCIVLLYLVISFVCNFIKNLCSDSIQSLLSIAIAIIEVPLSFGLTFALLKLFNNENVSAVDFLELGFGNFARSWGVTFRTFLKMLAPVLLVFASIILMVILSVFLSVYSRTQYIVSGVSSSSSVIATFMFFILFVAMIGLSIWATAKSYLYALANIVAMEHPEITAKEAVEKSAILMKGNRGKLFALQLSFIGWAILCCFTAGIGILWLIPYITFATIAFYKYLTGNSNTNVTTSSENIDANTFNNINSSNDNTVVTPNNNNDINS